MAPASDAAVNRVATLIIGLCVTGLAVTAALSLSPRLRQAAGLAPAPPPPAYSVGERIDVDSRLYADTPHTLLIFGRSTCGACQKSKPAYTEFVKLAGGAGVPARFITTERERAPEEAFATDMGLAADSVIQVPQGTLRVTHVPLLILIDSSGVIRHLWPSVPDDEQSADVRVTLRALAGTRR